MMSTVASVSATRAVGALTSRHARLARYAKRWVNNVVMSSAVFLPLTFDCGTYSQAATPHLCRADLLGGVERVFERQFDWRV